MKWIEHMSPIWRHQRNKLAAVHATGEPYPADWNHKFTTPTKENGGIPSYGEEAWNSLDKRKQTYKDTFPMKQANQLMGRGIGGLAGAGLGGLGGSVAGNLIQKLINAKATMPADLPLGLGGANVGSVLGGLAGAGAGGYLGQDLGGKYVKKKKEKEESEELPIEKESRYKRADNPTGSFFGNPLSQMAPRKPNVMPISSDNFGLPRNQPPVPPSMTDNFGLNKNQPPMPPSMTDNFGLPGKQPSTWGNQNISGDRADFMNNVLGPNSSNFDKPQYNPANPWQTLGGQIAKPLQKMTAPFQKMMGSFKRGSHIDFAIKMAGILPDFITKPFERIAGDAIDWVNRQPPPVTLLRDSTRKTFDLPVDKGVLGGVNLLPPEPTSHTQPFFNRGRGTIQPQPTPVAPAPVPVPVPTPQQPIRQRSPRRGIAQGGKNTWTMKNPSYADNANRRAARQQPVARVMPPPQ